MFFDSKTRNRSQAKRRPINHNNISGALLIKKLETANDIVKNWSNHKCLSDIKEKICEGNNLHNRFFYLVLNEHRIHSSNVNPPQHWENQYDVFYFYAFYFIKNMVFVIPSRTSWSWLVTGGYLIDCNRCSKTFSIIQKLWQFRNSFKWLKAQFRSDLPV